MYSIGSALRNIGVGKGFQNRTQFAQGLKQTIDK